MASERASLVLGLLVGVGLFAWFALRFVAAGVDVIDDAYISFRYAQHLIDGFGPVFNRGEEAVQGYTNFLWVMIMAATMAAGLPPIPTSILLGALSGVAVMVMTVAWSMRRVAPGSAAAYAAPILLVTNLGFVVWSMRGLETGLFTALVLAAGLVYLRRGPEQPFPAWAAACLALATLTRPEGALAAALTGLHAALARLRNRRWPVMRGDLPAVGLFILLVGIYAFWAWSYYGEPLPNTFHAKVGTPLDSWGRGMEYLKKFTEHGTGRVLYLLPLALLPRRRRDWTRSYAALLVVGWTLYVVLVGGDVFPAYRFLVPVFPHLYLLAGDAVAALEDAGRRLASHRRGGAWSEAAAGVGVTLLLATLALSNHHPSSAYSWREWSRGNRYTRDMKMVGVWLREHLPPGTRIAVNPAGALPYVSGLPTIDMLGLNDREIARTSVPRLGGGRLAGHEKGNGASVFRRRPEIILIGGVKLDKAPVDRSWTPHGRSERELARLPDLYRVYRVESRPMPDGRILTFLLRRDAAIDLPPAVG